MAVNDSPAARPERVVRPTFTHMLAGTSPRPSYVAWLAVTGICILALSVMFNELGLIHFEWWYYIPFQIGPGSVWGKIFNSRMLDQGIYAGRELSYLFDCFDSYAVAATVHAGQPVFVSVVHLALSVFMGVWLGWFVARDLKGGSLLGLLVAVLLWTTPFIYIHFLMRTAKGLVAASSVVLVVECWRALAAAGTGSRLARRRAGTIALAAGVMSFADRQGFYFLACALVLSGAHWALSRARVARDITFVLAAVLGVELVYFFWIAPALTQAFWSYSPDFSFNRLPVEQLVAAPGYFAGAAGRALLVTSGFTLGGGSAAVGGILILLLVAPVVVRDWRERAWRRGLPLAAVLLIMLAALWLMNALMILRHPPILWPDMLRAYYWTPASALTVLTLAISWGGAAAGQPGRRIALAGVLLVLIAGNLASLPEHRRVFAGGHLQGWIADSAVMREALMRRGDPDYVEPRELSRIPAYFTLRELAPLPTVQPAWNEFYFGGFHQATRKSGAPPRFVERFGGNIDSRFLVTESRFLVSASGQEYIGGREAQAQMRVGIVSNRIRGEVLVERAAEAGAGALAVEFAIYASPNDAIRFERWRQRVELPAGQAVVTVPYAIDSSHLPTLFTLEVPPDSVGRVRAGWLVPTITDVGSDSPTPVWFNRTGAPAVALDEAALARLLPDAWRPEAAWMRNGSVTATGIALQPGGEIWLKARGIVSHFSGEVKVPVGSDVDPAIVRGLWYKAGRVQSHQPPSPSDKTARTQTFQARCAEPGGWLVISADPAPGWGPVVVRVTAVKQE